MVWALETVGQLDEKLFAALMSAAERRVSDFPEDVPEVTKGVPHEDIIVVRPRVPVFICDFFGARDEVLSERPRHTLT